MSTRQYDSRTSPAAAPVAAPSADSAATPAASPRDWKRDGVVYQIYPKSFQDSNGDGVGDLRGIISRLDYLQWLGVSTVWISPFFASPMVDNGYDISDYYSVDPLFGTNDDLDELIDEARKRGIRILFDLVVNHCSDQHEWFRRACADPNAPERGYFIIRKKDQLTNWRSVFGGSVWSPMPGSDDEYYMHVFAKEQPDLNWESPALRREIYRMMNYWLDKGIGGFRVDAITYIKKNQAFPDFPADGPDGLASVDLGSGNQPRIGEFLTEMRRETFDKHDCMTVAEASDVPFAQLPAFCGPDGYFSMIFEFTYQDPYVDKTKPEWYRPKPWSVEEYKKLMFTAQEQQQRFGVWSPTHLENHDSPRSLTRLMRNTDVSYADEAGLDPAALAVRKRMQATMLGAMYFFLRGTPFIYQGQELGMENATMDSIDQFDDVFTRDQYQVALRAGLSEREAFEAVAFRSRDNGRTPMQWDAGESAGFTAGRPWLPVNRGYESTNVAVETADPHSVLAFYRAMVALRGDDRYRGMLVDGDCVPALRGEHNVVAYDRCGCGGRDGRIRVICNFQDKRCVIDDPWGSAEDDADGDGAKGAAAVGGAAAADDARPAESVRMLLSNTARTSLDPHGPLRLEPFEALVVLVRQ